MTFARRNFFTTDFWVNSHEKTFPYRGMDLSMDVELCIFTARGQTAI